MGEPARDRGSTRAREMSDRDFQRFRAFVFESCGIRLTPIKKTMLTGRLMKRLRALGMSDFSAYYDYVTSKEGRSRELHHMIDVVTTNKTDFFREPGHFDVLTRHCLPALLEGSSRSTAWKLRLWSSACSSGEEPYTLAMVLENALSRPTGRWSYEILATDISTRMLERARRAIYAEEKVEDIPDAFKRKYLMRGKGARKGEVRIVPELRNRVRFQRLNLLGDGGFGLRAAMDVVFCRNVIIYFDPDTQRRLFRRMYDQMAPGGFLFIGHSETLHGIHSGFVPVATSVYRKPW